MQQAAVRPRSGALSIRLPIWVWVLWSRAVVFAAGMAGSLLGHRIPDWQRYDPERLSSGLGAVGNVLASAGFRWDSIAYVTIAEHGYTTSASTRQFPLYPLLIRALTMIVGSPVIAGELISLVAFGVGLVLVHRIATEHVGRGAADATVLLIAFSPLSFVFSAVYTESLLLALLAGSFYLADHNRFGWACVCAAAASLTHIQGVLMVAPLALVYWNGRGRPRSLRGLWSPRLLALALPALTFGGFLSYMHAQGWGWLAPITSQNMKNAGRAAAGPLGTLAEAVGDTVTGLGQTVHGAPILETGGVAPGTENLILLVAFTIAILSLVSAWRRLPSHYALFAVLAIIVCTSSAVTVEPLKGFDRYMLPIFPLWIGAGAWLNQRKLLSGALMISTLLLIFYTVEFSRWVSVF